MKVAYNSCFGGFSLSPTALTEFARMKGVELTWYKQTGYKHNGNEQYQRIGGSPNSCGLSLIPLSVDAGDVISSLPKGVYYYPNFDELRSDSDLINVIETMGEGANGMCASLSIIEIPDGADFEIENYDGNESVVPPRQSW